MIRKISHVGIAVQNLEATLEFLKQAFDVEPSKKVQTPILRAAFIPIAEGEIELLQPTDTKSPMAKFIAKNGEGLHHVSFEVENVKEALKQLKKKRIQMIDEEPRVGVHGVKVAFLEPKSTKGILIELCEKPE